MTLAQFKALEDVESGRDRNEPEPTGTLMDAMQFAGRRLGG